MHGSYLEGAEKFSSVGVGEGTHCAFRFLVWKIGDFGIILKDVEVQRAEVGGYRWCYVDLLPQNLTKRFRIVGKTEQPMFPTVFNAICAR